MIAPVALINANRILPPIAPIGLEYAAESLLVSRGGVEILDLCWEPRWEEAIKRFLGGREYLLVGISIRNTDDCTLATRHSFLDDHAAVVAAVRRGTDAPVVLGGVGFSVMPEAVLDRCGADAGIVGDGEFTLPQLVFRQEARRDWDGLPNLVLRRGGRWRRGPASRPSLSRLPPMSRGLVDNRRYFREGGQAGIETKRGCPKKCIYCADPLAKGKSTRLRPPAAVADEISSLLAQGIDNLHTCDSEFNIPESHALAVCDEILARGLGGRIRWYAYCAPVPFSEELCDRMRRAGCAGINFGADSGDDGILKALGRDYRAEEIVQAAGRCRRAGIAVMLDLLLGSPGETVESVSRTLEMVEKAAPDRAGVAVGVRVYPGTPLASRLAKRGEKDGLIGGNDFSRPVFFLEPAVAPFLSELLDERIGDDPRFFFFDPSRPGKNYNYNANRLLADAIRDGQRGAYWDILRRIGGGESF
jgi:radical SAM superfamily enzyme YgiQ (UPF0313 family)